MLTTVKPKMRRLALVRSVNISIAAWIHIPIALRTSSATRCIGEEKVTQNIIHSSDSPPKLTYFQDSRASIQTRSPLWVSIMTCFRRSVLSRRTHILLKMVCHSTKSFLLAASQPLLLAIQCVQVTSSFVSNTQFSIWVQDLSTIPIPEHLRTAPWVSFIALSRIVNVFLEELVISHQMVITFLAVNPCQRLITCE